LETPQSKLVSKALTSNLRSIDHKCIEYLINAPASDINYIYSVLKKHTSTKDSLVSLKLMTIIHVILHSGNQYAIDSLYRNPSIGFKLVVWSQKIKEGTSALLTITKQYSHFLCERLASYQEKQVNYFQPYQNEESTNHWTFLRDLKELFLLLDLSLKLKVKIKIIKTIHALNFLDISR